MPDWNQTRIQKLIDDCVQESLTLDYKAAPALGRTNQKTDEITKDVSAMANSAGGIIIYGVREHREADKKHLPESIDPVDSTQFSREWLEQVINNIKPRVDGVLIYPVPIASAVNHVAYVIEIPQSTTAHQATDKRYYKRFNSLSVPMEDYEIRDIMGRRKHPNIELSLRIEITTEQHVDVFDRITGSNPAYTLVLRALNNGAVFAKYLNVFIRLPELIGFKKERFTSKGTDEDGCAYIEYRKENTIRDIITRNTGTLSPPSTFGPSRFNPLLPRLATEWEIRLTNSYDEVSLDGLKIWWAVYADNAPPKQGTAEVGKIPVVDLRT